MNERIKELRKALGLTLEKFGAALGVYQNGNVEKIAFQNRCLNPSAASSMSVKTGFAPEKVRCMFHGHGTRRLSHLLTRSWWRKTNHSGSVS